MWVITYLVFLIGGLAVTLGYLNYLEHEVFSITHFSLAVFYGVNLMICIWEISLRLYYDEIVSLYQAKKKKLPRNSLGRIPLFKDATPSEVFSFRFWTDIWATYSLADASYAEKKSFGYWIDCGNGFSMIIPTTMFMLGLTYEFELVPPRMIGLIGFVSNYQMWYGTVIYFWSYIVNKRWQAHSDSKSIVLGLVLFANILWFIFPMLAMQQAYQMIIHDAVPSTLWT